MFACLSALVDIIIINQEENIENLLLDQEKSENSCGRLYAQFNYIPAIQISESKRLLTCLNLFFSLIVEDKLFLLFCQSMPSVK